MTDTGLPDLTRLAESNSDALVSIGKQWIRNTIPINMMKQFSFMKCKFNFIDGASVESYIQRYKDLQYLHPDDFFIFIGKLT